MLVALSHVASLLVFSVLGAPTKLEVFRNGGWDPRPLVRRTPLVGTETERFAGTSVAEVINSSGSFARELTSYFEMNA